MIKRIMGFLNRKSPSGTTPIPLSSAAVVIHDDGDCEFLLPSIENLSTAVCTHLALWSFLFSEEGAAALSFLDDEFMDFIEKTETNDSGESVSYDFTDSTPAELASTFHRALRQSGSGEERSSADP